jgi:hypothetical protein
MFLGFRCSTVCLFLVGIVIISQMVLLSCVRYCAWLPNVILFLGKLFDGFILSLFFPAKQMLRLLSDFTIENVWNIAFLVLLTSDYFFYNGVCVLCVRSYCKLTSLCNLLKLYL